MKGEAHGGARYEAVRACKWVDEVVEDAPFVTELEVIDKHNIDYVVHGDDISSAADGTDAYYFVKQAGRYREFKRTEGVSTTELVGRMLLCSRDHLVQSTGQSGLGGLDAKQLDDFSSDGPNQSTRIMHFLPTSHRIVQFSDGREPKPDDTVVYVDGTFDLFRAQRCGPARRGCLSRLPCRRRPHRVPQARPRARHLPAGRHPRRPRTARGLFAF